MGKSALHEKAENKKTKEAPNFSSSISSSSSYFRVCSLWFQNSENPESINSPHLLILLQSRKKGKINNPKQLLLL